MKKPGWPMAGEDDEVEPRAMSDKGLATAESAHQGLGYPIYPNLRSIIERSPTFGTPQLEPLLGAPWFMKSLLQLETAQQRSAKRN